MQLHLEPSSEGNKIRVIPLELQKLFSQLLLLDVASVSTCQLTESFGWTDHEVRHNRSYSFVIVQYISGVYIGSYV
jgi:hypothetical protein